MARTSHFRFHDIDSILVEDNDSMFIVPKSKKDIIKLRPYFFDRDFMLNYDNGFKMKSYAFIERMQLEPDSQIRLYPQYIIRDSNKSKYTHFEVIGDAIDDFFSPAKYFYKRAKKEEISDFECLYHSIFVDDWGFKFEGHKVKVFLSFGNILQRGIASDLKLHARLTVRFFRTSDIQFIYRLYSLIVRFIKIIRFEVNWGSFCVDLYDEEKGKKSYNGRLIDYSLQTVKFNRGMLDMNYTCYEPYIQRFLQFAADNPDYTFNHYPSDSVRFLGRHYSSLDFISIFSAFEKECSSNPELFEKVDASDMNCVREKLLNLIDENDSLAMSDDEKAFVNHAKERIKQLGTQYGQKRKIVNAYQVMKRSLDSSIEHIFILPEFRRKGHLDDKDIKEVAKVLSEQRGKIAHGTSFDGFSDMDARRIKFLEILTHAMMLKRLGLDYPDIERIIGAVFSCNYIVFNEQFS